MVTEINEKVADKIKKLLALAGNNSSEDEAEAALLKAQELMAQHNITKADVADIDDSEDIGIGYTDETIAAVYKLHLAHVIAMNFKVMVFTTRVGHGMAARISFYGFESDVETAKSVFKFVLQAMEYNWWHRYYGKVRGNKRDYSMGFVRGLDAKLRQQVEQQGWGLIVQTPKEVKYAADKGFKSVKHVSTACVHRSDAYLYGQTDGYQFDHTKKMIG
jgi:hypothetical protein